MLLLQDNKKTTNNLTYSTTKLGRIINDKEEPNVGLSYRLEKHTGNLIKAETWWQLIVKKQAFIISKDVETRRKEQQKVRNYLLV